MDPVQRQLAQGRPPAVGELGFQIPPKLAAPGRGGFWIGRSRERCASGRERGGGATGQRLQIGQPGQHAGFPGVSSPARPLGAQGLDRRFRRERTAVEPARGQQEVGPRGDIAVSILAGIGECRLGFRGSAVAETGDPLQQPQACTLETREPDLAQLRQKGLGFGSGAMLEHRGRHLQAQPASQRIRVTLGQAAGPPPLLGRERPAFRLRGRIGPPQGDLGVLVEQAIEQARQCRVVPA